MHPTPLPLEGNRAIVVIPENYNVNARADISVNAEVLQVLSSGTEWIAIGRTIDNTWLYIVLNEGQFAWVYADAIIINLEEIDRLSIIIPDSIR